MADLWIFLVSVALVALSPPPAKHGTPPSAKTEEDGDVKSPLQRKYYEFHNNFWMNLHHTLFREMVAGKMDEQAKKQTGLVPLSDAALSDQEKKAWAGAVQHYSPMFAGRRLLFDDQLVTINSLLGQQKDPQKLDPSGLPEDFVKCLESAAPVYRNHWWAEHRKANEQFIAEMQPRVDDFAPTVIPQLERFFEMQWPPAPLQVDVTFYVAEIGNAYTTEDPGHSTIASSREDNHGLPGLETLFHEGAHTMTDKMASALWDECKRQKKDCGDLWHAVQFYTVGVVVKETLAAHDTPGYVPYAYRFGLYERGEWPKFRAALERDWQPYLDGKATFDEAITNMVHDIAVTRHLDE